MPYKNTPGQQVMLKVVAKLGEQRVAQRLGISPSLLDRLVRGAMAVPDPLMLKAVDLVLEEVPQDIPAVHQDFQKPRGKPVI
jgi:hypothetical protein